jgi:succinoglycan biosynthesis transport protein ExoP
MNENNTARQKKKALGDAGLAGLEYYGFQDYRNLLSRRKWMIATTVLTIALLVSVAAYMYPNLYLASAVIVVDPGKVPESYVKSTATIDANQRLAMLQEQILSTTKLGQVTDELGLYRNLNNTRTQEEIVAQMNKNIKVEPATNAAQVRGLQAFKVSFTSGSPVLAARVCNRLASLFIEENMKVREQQVLGTADFFDRELEKARQDLDNKAQKVAQLRSKYAAALPESQNLHLQALTVAQMELRAEIDAAGRAEQQKLYLQSLLSEDPAVVNLDNSGHSADTAGLQAQLEHLQTDMDELRSRYGPNYPDVQTKTVEIKKVEQQIQELEKSHPQTRSVAATGVKHHNPVVEGQIAQLSDEIQKHEARQRELKSQIAYYQSSLERAPEAEQRLTEATNDYASAADRYKRLEDHKFGADMSSDVEARQKGERFVILEPAQPPERPYAPNRPLIDLLGLVAGLATALFLVLGLEILDTTVKTQRELSERIKAPVFGEIPWLITSSNKKQGRFWTTLAVTGNMVLALGYVRLLASALR